MATFNDLSLDLLPLIVQNIVQPHGLASLCLVNKIFCRSAQHVLYRTILVLSSCGFSPHNPAPSSCTATCNSGLRGVRFGPIIERYLMMYHDIHCNSRTETPFQERKSHREINRAPMAKLQAIFLVTFTALALQPVYFCLILTDTAHPRNKGDKDPAIFCPILSTERCHLPLPELSIDYPFHNQ